MSFILADPRGYLADGPTNSGLQELVAWAEATKMLALMAFLDDGETDDVAELIDELESVTAEGGVEESRSALLAAARKAEGRLVLSDGL